MTTRVTKKAKAGRALMKKPRRPSKAKRVERLEAVIADPATKAKDRDLARRLLATHQAVAA